MTRKTLSIIGAGKVGKTLGRLWVQHGVFEILDVLATSDRSADDAAAFIQAGRAVTGFTELRRADVYLLATTDDRIEECCRLLAAAGLLSAGSIVFHCSGALSSQALTAAAAVGASTASVHPVRSFASPEAVAASFDGTFCGAEGNPQALATLLDAFRAIGARPLLIDAASKTLYHAAAVFASNYLVTLLDTAQRAYVGAGIAEQDALALMEPLVRETVNNVFRLGPAAALTGPIARGDGATVDKQQQEVLHWNAVQGRLYTAFIAPTEELAARKPRK